MSSSTNSSTSTLTSSSFSSVSSNNPMSETSGSLPSLQSIVSKNIRPVADKTPTAFLEGPGQSKINYIHHCLLICNIHSNKDLDSRFPALLERICQNPTIFNSISMDKDVEFLTSVIHSYGVQHGYKLDLPIQYGYAIKEYLTEVRSHTQPVLQVSSTHPDLSRVKRSYDKLSSSKKEIQATSDRFTAMLNRQKHIYCPTLILGAGDTGTTVWLEKYKNYHNTLDFQKKNPPILMIGEDLGIWGHNYTLGQRHSFLERCGAKANLSDYMSETYYKENPYANGRHLLQANTVNLASTQAPLLLGMDILHIEKRENHTENWKYQQADYRVALFNHKTQETYHIYTNNIDASTGLGPANNNMIEGAKNSQKQTILDKTSFQRLNRFDPKKNFTPIVDGNQFALTPIEQLKNKRRKIVTYGGGGTAVACARIVFHDHDNRTEELGFNEKVPVNEGVLIAARSFDKAGKGRLITQVLERSDESNEIHIAELMSIKEKNDKLSLTFLSTVPSNDKSLAKKPASFEIECDQLVYAGGQDTSKLRSMTDEIQDDLEFVVNKNKIPSCVRTRDKSIHFYGAVATILKPEYTDSAAKWLIKNNIGEDTVPGGLPPTRALLKAHLAENGTEVENINANVDDRHIIKSFLLDAGVDKIDVAYITHQILRERGLHTWGMSQEILQSILNFYDINDRVKVSGHTHLVRREE